MESITIQRHYLKLLSTQVLATIHHDPRLFLLRLAEESFTQVLITGFGCYFMASHHRKLFNKVGHTIGWWLPTTRPSNNMHVIIYQASLSNFTLGAFVCIRLHLVLSIFIQLRPHESNIHDTMIQTSMGLGIADSACVFLMECQQLF